MMSDYDEKGSLIFLKQQISLDSALKTLMITSTPTHTHIYIHKQQFLVTSLYILATWADK